MHNISTEILRDAKETILYQRIVIMLLIMLLIGVTLCKIPKETQEPNQTQYISEAVTHMNITPIKPAEYGRAKLKKYRFGKI